MNRIGIGLLVDMELRKVMDYICQRFRQMYLNEASFQEVYVSELYSFIVVSSKSLLKLHCLSSRFICV